MSTYSAMTIVLFGCLCGGFFEWCERGWSSPLDSESESTAFLLCLGSRRFESLGMIQCRYLIGDIVVPGDLMVWGRLSESEADRPAMMWTAAKALVGKW
jgi:hypothetical protein